MRSITPPGFDAYKPRRRPPHWHRPPRYFVVQGEGFFPEELLDRNQAWALTGVNLGGDAAFVTEQTRRSVILATWRWLDEGLWLRFGWSVVEKNIPRPDFLPPHRSR